MSYCFTVLRTYAKEIKAVRNDLKAGPIGYLFRHIIQAFKVGVNYFVSFQKDDVGVREWFYTVVTATSSCKTYFENLTKRFHEHDITVNRAWLMPGKRF